MLFLVVAAFPLAAQEAAPDSMRQITHIAPAVMREIVAIRDTAWRAYFANDTAVMHRLFPENFISVGWGGGPWDGRGGTLAGAAHLAADGGRLLTLGFPHTEVQLFGDLAVVYSLYEVSFEVNGQVVHQSGRATEVFRRRGKSWDHPSWHLDSGR
jgi:ketosteroid isomerase-like protein